MDIIDELVGIKSNRDDMCKELYLLGVLRPEFLLFNGFIEFRIRYMFIEI